MGIGDYVDKAKHALAGREEQVAGALDKAADAVKSRTSPDTDRKIDSAVDKAKDFLSKQTDGHRDSTHPGTTDDAAHRATGQPHPGTTPGTSGPTPAPRTDHPGTTH